MADACSTCRFWDVYPDGVDPHSVDDCRRRAPRISDALLREFLPRGRDAALASEIQDDLYPASAFPVTHRTNWCGEFEGARA